MISVENADKVLRPSHTFSTAGTLSLERNAPLAPLLRQMRHVVLALAAVAAAFGQTQAPPAQVPDTSTVGSTTIYVRDTTIPVPYGPDETRAVVTACMSAEVSYVYFNLEHVNASIMFTVTSGRVTKTDSGWCSTILAPVAKADLLSVDVAQVASHRVIPPPPPTGTAPPPQAASLPEVQNRLKVGDRIPR